MNLRRGAMVAVLVTACRGSRDARAPGDTGSAVDTLVGLSPGVIPSPKRSRADAGADALDVPTTTSDLQALARNLIIPVQGVVTSQLRDSYTDARVGHVHEALDIMAPKGTPILAATDGRVLKLHHSAAGGIMIYAADATDRFIMMYGHLDRYADGLVEGMPIRKGQLLGFVGTTGNARAGSPHLHFAVATGHPSVAWWKGQAVNPYTLFVHPGAMATIENRPVAPPVVNAPSAPVVAAPSPSPTVAAPPQVAVTPTKEPVADPVTAAPLTSDAVRPHYELTSTAAKKIIAARAKLVIAALAAHDMTKLSTLVHPTLGLRFSPYQHVDRQRDRVIKKDLIKSLWPNKKVSVWGMHDGSGAPLRLTYAEYHKSFVYDVDFAHGAAPAYNDAPVGKGNTPNTIAESYPRAIVVEYHLPGVDPKAAGMDWKSLWLVFEKQGTTWYLVGVVHGAWTI